ncbi:uncharacterized protein LOC135956092 [Calliphora vicina]|uniref:uncharacterized protein LOC135956092 n=1 Tax=Calliphora vicina TaxID=7373 RepID=UPI00325AF8AA
MELKCLDQFTSSLILAALTLVACVVRAEFLISVLYDIIKPKEYANASINVILVLNVVVYLILAILCILLMYAIVKRNHMLMMPWLVVALLSVSCEVLFVIYILATGHSKYVLYLLIGTALGLWIIWVIFSLFKSIRHENLMTRSENIRGFRFNVTRAMEIY